MIKKFGSILVFVILSLFCSVFAEETKCIIECLPKTDGSQKTVFSVSGNAGDEIILKLYNFNVDPDNKVTAENIETSVIYVDQKTVGEDGKCRFAYSFPVGFQEGSTYPYVIHNVNTGERIKGNTEYYLQGTLNGVLSSIYDNSTLSAEEAFENLFKYRKSLGINSLLLEMMHEEMAIPQSALNVFKEEEYTVAERNAYSEAFNSVLYMDAINYMNRENNLLKLIDKNEDVSVAEELGLLTQPEALKRERYEKILASSSEKKSYLIGLLKNKRPFETNEEFVEAFNECAFLCRLNLAQNASEIELLINESTDLLEKGAAFVSKSETEQAKIARILYDHKNKNSSDDFSDEIQKAFSALNRENSGSISQGGSSGGGGRGSISVTNSVKTDVKTIEEVKESAETRDKVKLLFKDMDSTPWAIEPVSILSELGVINGKAEDVFAPNDNVLREELVKMAVCLFDVYDSNAVSYFEDISADDWFSSYVASAEKIGAVNGVSGSEFGSGHSITREQAITILYRFSVKCGLTFSEDTEYIPFDDDDKISDYAQEAIRAFAGCNIVSGYENLIMPNAYCSRAEIAKILYNIYLLSLKTSE